MGEWDIQGSINNNINEQLEKVHEEVVKTKLQEVQMDDQIECNFMDEGIFSIKKIIQWINWNIPINKIWNKVCTKGLLSKLGLCSNYHLLSNSHYRCVENKGFYIGKQMLYFPPIRGKPTPYLDPL